MRTGFFIAICGIDGAGKGTQAKMLYNWLKKRGYTVHLTSEPTNGMVGRLIKKILEKDLPVDPKTLALLFVADRMEHQNEINENLERGIVITDRYSLSTLAYQSAQGVPLSWLKQLHKGIKKPNVSILLDIDPKIAISRLKSKQKFERLEFLQKVRQKYLELADENIFIISTRKSKKKTFDEIKKVIERQLAA